jgi:hypothetical protein
MYAIASPLIGRLAENLRATVLLSGSYSPESNRAHGTGLKKSVDALRIGDQLRPTIVRQHHAPGGESQLHGRLQGVVVRVSCEIRVRADLLIQGIRTKRLAVNLATRGRLQERGSERIVLRRELIQICTDIAEERGDAERNMFSARPEGARAAVTSRFLPFHATPNACKIRLS